VVFRLEFSPEADRVRAKLESSSPARYRKLGRVLFLMSTNLKHNSLETHKFDSEVGPNGEQLWVAYVENNTPNAYRILWYYGPGKRVITIYVITGHY